MNSFLNSLTNNESHSQSGQYTLDHMTALLEALGNPHQEIKFIHIAGTNGKGSACMMLAAIFESAGYKTGLYTSPHLIKINERIKINSLDISDKLLDYYLGIIEKKINEKSIHPTFFDVMTAVSILYFYDEKTDIAVMETGLGGRLDSTNVITPLCSVITDISFDHENLLGNSIDSITAEKCGIIKRNIPAVTTNTSPDIISIIKKRCIELNSDFFLYGKDFSGENPELLFNKISFDFIENFNNNKINSISINHPGQFQIKNASAAIFTSLLLKNEFSCITDSIIIESLNKLKLPGRFEILSENPLILFDPAHNVEAVKNVLNIISTGWISFDVNIIFSLMADKNIQDITDMVAVNCKNAIYYQLDDPRAFNPDEKWLRRTGIEVITEKIRLQEYIACKKSEDSLFLFIGSFRLYETAIQIIKNVEP